jgi:hypothetical protein
MYMTKVSWKRILQRAGNDLPSHGRPFAERPHLQAVARSGPRPVRLDEGPHQVAGELESELRRALQRAQATSHHEPQDQGWDPIFMAQELRHHEPVAPVPAAHYIQAQAPRRRSSAARTLIAVSLSAVVVGVAVQQLSGQWGSETEYGGGGGGGGGNGDGTEYRSTEQASLGAVTKDQGKLVQTGYAIQPLVHPGNPTDLAPVEEAPRGSRLAPPQDTSDEAAAMFRRDMEEARKLFDRKDEPALAATARAAEPAPAPAAEPAPPPAQIAAVAPARIAPPAQKAAPAAPAQQAPAGPPVSGAEENKLMQRASDLMQRGDITGARLLFEHLARRGSAIGAFALAQSYDPKYLQKMYVRGLTPDQKQADFWYRKAAELGGTTAMEGGRSGR